MYLCHYLPPTVGSVTTLRFPSQVWLSSFPSQDTPCVAASQEAGKVNRNIRVSAATSLDFTGLKSKELCQRRYCNSYTALSLLRSMARRLGTTVPWYFLMLLHSMFNEWTLKIEDDSFLGLTVVRDLKPFCPTQSWIMRRKKIKENDLLAQKFEATLCLFFRFDFWQFIAESTHSSANETRFLTRKEK